MISQCGFLPWSRSRCLWAFSIMMMTASTIAPMAMAMPPSDMMFELMPWPNMTRKEISTAIGRMTMATKRAAQVHQEREADQRHDDAFLEQFFFERLDRAVNQRGAVIGDGVVHIRRQALHRLRRAASSRLDDLARVRAVAHDDDAADGFAFAVQFGDAAPHVGAELRCSPPRRSRIGTPLSPDADGDFLQVVEVLDVAAHAQDEFLFRQFEERPPTSPLLRSMAMRDLGDREVVGAQFGRDPP